jgi:glycosyltransferase involved in cell wall biosynthesis
MVSQRSAARWAAKVVVHGERQARLVSRWTSRRVISVPLPGSTLDRRRDDEALGEYLLCLGEVRPNKGIDVVISAAQIASLPLIVAGAPEPTDFGVGVTRAASAASSVELRLWFQSDEEFAELMSAARVILLPYMHFDAQSGVLARAMHLGKRIVASDLSSLREQAGEYPHISFVKIGDTAAWAHSMEAAFSLGDRDSPLTQSSSAEQDWDAVASTIFG